MIQYNGEVYRELRCPSCRTLLAEEYVYSGRIRIKCRQCKEVVVINFKSLKNN